MQANAYQWNQGRCFPYHRQYCELGGRQNADQLLLAKADGATQDRETQPYHQQPTKTAS